MAEQQNIVGGLFGVTPESYSQQQRLLDQAAALNYAKLTPGEQAGYGGMMAGQQLGRATQSLLGVEDPQLQAIRKVQELSRQFDTTTAGGLTQFAQALQQAGLPQYAAMAADKANSMAQAQTETAFKQSQIMKNLAEAAKAGNVPEASVPKIADALKNNKILSDTNAEVDKYQKMVDNGEVTFNLGSNIKAGLQGLTGKQDQNTLDQVTIKKFFKNETNNILMAAKGTQTEGDAKRATEQIINDTDWNSNASVSNAFKDLKALKQRQIDANNVYVDVLRSGRAMPGESASKSPTTPTGGTSAGVYAKVKSQPGWENASNAEIDAAIKAGKIKVGKVQ